MAVVREDVVKLTFEYDDKEMKKANDAMDDLVDDAQKLGGKDGIKKASQDAYNLCDTSFA